MTTGKSTRWQFTAYEDQWRLFTTMPRHVAEWGWQLENCPKTKRDHYQGYFRTHQQCRHEAVRKLFPGVHIEIARDWTALVAYCKKTETKVEGFTPVHEYNDFPDMFSYSEDLASRIPPWEEIRRAWMSHTENYMREARRLETESSVLGLTIYASPEEYAYYVILPLYIEYDIAHGRPVEFITQNPLFLTVWKNKLKEILLRRSLDRQNPPSILDRQTDTPTNILISFD